MKKLHFVCFLLCILLLSGMIHTSQLSAQSGASTIFSTVIKGQVSDSLTNEVIPYATLRIVKTNEPEKTVKMLSTDADGKFQTSLPGTGEFLLTSKYIGKSSLNVTFQITGTEKTVDLGKLLIHDDQVLGEVVVSAIKPLVQVELDKISYSIEDDPDSKTNNVLDMMKKVPMITVDAEDNVQLRGSSSYKIYLDGKPSNMITSNPGQVLKGMPANMVKKIEVITDPGAKYDAEGVSGIINIITNKQPMGGYTGTVNASADLRGSSLGGYLTAKYGKFGLTGNYNYYYNENPSSNSNSSRESFYDDTNKLLETDGANSSYGRWNYGTGELSYEMDTLNLFSASFDQWGGSYYTRSGNSTQMLDVTNSPIYAYAIRSRGKSTYGSTEINANYQRTFTKKDELLTASYRLTLSPNDQKYTTDIDSILNYHDPSQQSATNAETKEHTFQVDYTTPISTIHTIEAGVKYIIRISESDSYRDIFNSLTNEWVPYDSYINQFHHRQDIFSGYGGYNLKYKNIGFKAGLRLENTNLDVHFPLDETKNFDNGYVTLIPSATFSFKYKKVHNFRLGYNMRIQRPGIWYLNPYIDDSDPKNISYGNPDLNVEKAHNFNLNYGIFKTKFNLNMNLFYRFVNNSIERITTLDEDISKTTYENIGKEKTVGLFFYGSWNPTAKFRIYANASGSYNDIRANDGSGIKNTGFMGQIYGGLQYTLPHDMTVSLNGAVISPSVNLQGQSTGYHYSALALNKSFLRKKLTFTLSTINPFEDKISYRTINQTNQFSSVSDYSRVARNFRISVSYKFGEMKQQIQRVKRGINNDDTKGGQNGGGGESSSGGQQQ